MTVLILLAALFALGWEAAAQPLQYEDTLANAVARAKYEGKFVLADFGRSDCSECIKTTQNWEDPAVKRWLQAAAVPWRLDIQQSSGWQPYTTGLEGASLPVIVWIDPFKPNAYFFRANGLISELSTTRLITNQAMNYLPLMVLNLPGTTLTNHSFTVQGIAKTNAAISGAVVNVAISKIMWRLESGTSQLPPFQPAATTTPASRSLVTWSQPVILTPGANVFAAYVLYANGASSWTNRVTLAYDGPTEYLGPNLIITSHTNLQVVTGSTAILQGSASDAGEGDNGIASVTVNGKPASNSNASGSGVANWSANITLGLGSNTMTVVATDTVGNATTNVILLVSIAPPVDTTPPSLAITSHSDLQAVATNKILFTGTASDAGLGENGIVSVKINGVRAAGDSASGSGVANWGLALTLAPGTNTLKVVATDGAPAHNATTNVIRILSDRIRPTLQITSPVKNQRSSNAVFAIQGTAKDSGGVAQVQYQLNGGQWLSAQGTTVWRSDVTLTPGTNTVKAFALDVSGNQSLTNTVTFFYALSDRLTLLTSGIGTVSPNYSNALLELGKNYTITADPGAGQVFSCWTGGVSASTPTLKFQMQSNLVLQANFVLNPFTALKGNYNGLFYPIIPDEIASATNSGFLTAKVTDKGSFTGKLLLAGITTPLSGAFDGNLHAQISVAQRGKPTLALSLQLTPQPTADPVTGRNETNSLSGTIAAGTSWQAEVWGYRAATASANGPAGSYTMVIAGCEDYGQCLLNTNEPWGDGPASVRINSAGTLQMIGTLADGKTISQSTAISEQGYWPVFVSLYGGRGFLGGWIDMNNDLWGNLTWQMPQGSRYYTNGVRSIRPAYLAKYTTPAPGQNAANWTNATAVLLGGALPSALTNQVSLQNNVLHVLGGTISNLHLSITLTNGWFKGSFVHPANGKATTLNGVLGQAPPGISGIGNGGWFLGPDGSGGIIRFHPN